MVGLDEGKRCKARLQEPAAICCPCCVFCFTCGRGPQHCQDAVQQQLVAWQYMTVRLYQACSEGTVQLLLQQLPLFRALLQLFTRIFILHVPPLLCCCKSST